MKIKQGKKDIEITAEHMHNGAMAHADFKDGKNPPGMVEDEDTWEKAKAAALKSYDLGDDAFWPATMAIYENMGGEVKHAKASARNTVRAAHGEITGKPSMSTLQMKVNQAIQEDPRWDTDKHGYPEGHPNDWEPYVCDILVPDDDGQMCAIIRTDDGRLVKHEFTWDGSGVEMAPGDGEPVEQSMVYSHEVSTVTERVKATSRMVRQALELVKAGTKQYGEAMKEFTVEAAGSSDGAAKGHASKKSESAHEASSDAHEASAKAHDSGEEDDHKEAMDAHEEASDKHFKAMKANAKAGNDDKAKEHANAMKAHDQLACMHGEKCGDEEHAKASSSQSMKDAVKCRASNGTQIKAEAWEPGKPVEFVYMPAGMHSITAGFRDDESISICVVVDEDTAKACQESFDHLTATYPKQEPFGDEDHEGRKATLRFPKGTEFAYGSLNGEEGVIVKGAHPTSYGAECVNGKTYRSWSPEFATDAEYSKAKSKKGHVTFPDGVRGSESNPAKIVGVNFVTGALTNRPAFAAMPPVKAKKPEKKAVTVEAVFAKVEEQRVAVDRIAAKAASQHVKPTLESIYSRMGVNG